MEWVIAVVVVAVIGLIAVAGTGAFGQLRSEPIRDVYRQPRSDEPLTSADLDQVRFAITARGYAVGQVDEFLDRVRTDLARLEAELALAQGGGVGVESAEPDPFAEYGLDGGQGVPHNDTWYDGDGGSADEADPEGPIRQHVVA